MKRKEDWKKKAEEEERKKPDPDCPPGHRKLSEEDRRKVLAKLKQCELFFLKQE